VSKTAEEDDPLPGLDYLIQEIRDYWDRRRTIIALLGYPPLKDFLATQLQGARRYDRIAGFFSRLLLFDVNAKIKAILGE